MEEIQPTIIDTNILIDFLRGKHFFSEQEQIAGIHISSITAFELLHGAYKTQRKKNIQKTQELIERVHTHAFTAREADIAANLHAQLQQEGKPIDLPDLFIAATAISKNLPIHTNNKKHFINIPNLQIKKQQT